MARSSNGSPPSAAPTRTSSPEPPRPLVVYRGHRFAAEIVEAEGFELLWTDHVANDWSETDPSLALAVVRLGLLIAAVDEDRLFRGLPPAFASRVTRLAELLAAFVEQGLDPPTT